MRIIAVRQSKTRESKSCIGYTARSLASGNDTRSSTTSCSCCCTCEFKEYEIGSSNFINSIVSILNVEKLITEQESTLLKSSCYYGEYKYYPTDSCRYNLSPSTRKLLYKPVSVITAKSARSSSKAVSAKFVRYVSTLACLMLMVTSNLSIMLFSNNVFNSSNSNLLMMKPYINISSVVNANNTSYAIVNNRPSLALYCMTNLDKKSTVVTYHEVSKRIVKLLTTNIVPHLPFIKINVSPIFTVNESFSATRGFYSPTIASESSLAGEYNRRIEYLDFYKAIVEDGPLIVAGAIMSATEDVMLLKQAVARFVAMGYTTMPSVAYRSIAADLGWLISAPVIKTGSVAFDPFSSRVYRVYFRAPPVITNAGKVIISRVVIPNYYLMFASRTVHDLVYYSAVIFHSIRADMFVGNLHRFSSVINEALNEAITNLGVAADECVGLEPVLNIIEERPSVIVKNAKRKFEKYISSDVTKFENVIDKVFYKPFDLSKFLNSVIRYSSLQYKAFATAAISAVLFSAFARRYAETTGKYYKRAMRIVAEYLEKKSKDKSTLEKIVKGQVESLLGAIVARRELIKHAEDTVRTIVSLPNISSDVLNIKVCQETGKVDVTPTSLFDTASSILENFISFALGSNLALYDLINRIAGINPYLHRMVYSNLRRLGEWLLTFDFDKVSEFSRVLGLLVPKDIQSLLNEVRDFNKWYSIYSEIFGPVLLELYTLAPFAPKMARELVITIESIEKALRSPILSKERIENVLTAMYHAGVMQKIFFRAIGATKVRFKELYNKEIEEVMKKYPTSPMCGSLPQDFLDLEEYWAWKKKFIG